MSDRRANITPFPWTFIRLISVFFDFILFRRIKPRRIPTGIELVRFEKQIKDFAGGSMALLPQRQVMFLSAVLLTGFFYDLQTAILCFVLCEITELLDYFLAKRILAWDGKKGVKAVQYHYLLIASSILSASAVGTFVLLTASLEGPSLHLTPLFFLFAAGLFAAVNNHQLPKALLVRLVIYGLVFLFIPLRDLYLTNPPLYSVLWLQLLTVVFVLYFVVDCSIIFLKLYRRGLDQLEELRQERDRATNAYEVKSQFVSVVSHELRTPLTSIIFALDLLKNGALGDDKERTKETLNIAHTNSKHLAALINDLLDLQKLDSGKMNYNFEVVEINEPVTQAVAAISSMAASVPVHIQFEPNDTPILVSCDTSKIQQVLSNLLSNAIKFSHPEGQINVSIALSGACARVTIEDFGTGIPEFSRDKVFGKFGQIDSTDHRSFAGSGLGLSIAEQIIEAHNGMIDYDSVLGKGTSFYFELPLAG